ncbi:MAG: (d)CMP kinase [bacterium]
MGIVIAIDGPAGAGKSTVSKLLAKRLSFSYLDTGAMYRAVTYLVIKNGIDINNHQEIDELVSNTDILFVPPADDGISHIIVNNEDVTDKIRTSNIDKNVSRVARIKSVRDAMVKIQRKIAQNGNIIMDGRDIGSKVLPDADIKFFITASLEERSRRRYLDLEKRERDIDIEEVKRKIADRDKLDTEREISPLVRTSDSILIDTTNISIEDTVNMMIDIVKGECNVKKSL